ncbi:hypothetical protein [Streptomyces alfalfae]|uniref:hypothetical protein n=1 Tax=Streptomyces alfalfae TaxID=1642299 RepID=UPI003AAFA0C0
MLRKALERSSAAAIAKFAWHGRERLGLLRVKEDVIVLHALSTATKSAPPRRSPQRPWN